MEASSSSQSCSAFSLFWGYLHCTGFGCSRATVGMEQRQGTGGFGTNWALKKHTRAHKHTHTHGPG